MSLFELFQSMAYVLKELFRYNSTLKGLAMTAYFKFHFFSTLANILAYLKIPPIY